MADSYLCSICGQAHQGAPLSWGPETPDMWMEIPLAEREQRGVAGTDQTIIDDRHFFVRGRIEIPVVDRGELFAWLVWVEVSADDFFRMGDLWTVQGREKKARPYDGHLANRLPAYSSATLGLQIKLHTRPVGERPFIEVVGDHQIRDEQRDGISSHYVQEIADQLLKE